MLKVECAPNKDKKSVITIFIDGEPWRHVHTSIFSYRPALPKECASMERLEEKFDSLEYQQAKLYAFKRLSQMSMPSTTLMKSLRQRLVNDHTINRLIEDLKSTGYLNDKEWIASFIRVQSNKKMGPRAIAQKLAMKGLPADQLEEMSEAEQSQEAQKESIMQLLATRYRTRNLSDFREKNKVVAALARRGFDISIILDVLSLRESFSES